MVLRFGCTERVNDSMVVIFGLLRDFNIIFGVGIWVYQTSHTNATIEEGVQ